MTYGKLNASVPVLRKLVGQDLHLRQAYHLTKIAKKVNEELVFFNTKYEEIVKSEASEEEKIKMMTELLNFDVPWDLVPLVLSPDTEITVSASDLEAVRGLVEVDEKEE